MALLRSDPLAKVFADPTKIASVFWRIPTANDSRKHGFLFPRAAYGLLPEFAGFTPTARRNYSFPIITLWPDQRQVWKASSFRHYHRYPERRLSGLHPVAYRRTNALIIGRRIEGERILECHVVARNSIRFQRILRYRSIVSARNGTFFPDLSWKPADRLSVSWSAQVLLGRFDRLIADRWLDAHGRADNAVGLTVQKKLTGVTADNKPIADYKGVEIKGMLSGKEPTGKVKLFLSAPAWKDGLSSRGRLLKYGYLDRKKRRALKCTIGMKANAQHLRLRIDDDNGKVLLLRQGKTVASWDFAKLDARLQEKVGEKLLFLAARRKQGSTLQFRYHTVLYLVEPSIAQFIALLRTGMVTVDSRLHAEGRGSQRDRGFQFRVRASALIQLFERIESVRTFPV